MRSRTLNPTLNVRNVSPSCGAAVLILAHVLLLPAATLAQRTNLEIYQVLAGRCLADAPAHLDTFHVAGPDGMPYLRSALTQHWREQGRTLFVGDSTSTHPLPYPRLQIDVDGARVTYERERRRHLRRTVALDLRYTLTGADGRLLDEQRCREFEADMVPRAALTRIETPAYPETHAEVPEAGWVRRYLEPALLTAATAVTIYLFFSLRSEGADDGS